MNSYVSHKRSIKSTTSFILVFSGFLFIMGCSSSSKKPTDLDTNTPSSIGFITEVTAESSINPYLDDTPSVASDASEWFQKGLAALQNNNFTEAENWFIKINDKYNRYSGSWLNLGIIASKNKEWSKAEEHLKKAININGNNIYAFNQLGFTYRSQGKFDLAEEQYIKATQIWNGYSEAWLNLGILYDLYLNKAKPAMQAYQNFQKLQKEADPDVNRWIKDLKQRHPNEFPKK